MSPERLDALELARDLEPTPKNIQRLSAQVGEEAARWAFTQWELRKRARAKFALADQMLFDRDGLEMATHERVAAYHASHFPEGETVADLSCGIGGDLIALAQRGPVVGYETDPLRAEYARHNLKVHGLEAEVRTESPTYACLPCDSAFLDPQRRGNHDFGTPDPRILSEACDNFKTIGIKLGPGVDLTRVQKELFDRVEAVSFDGECREVATWLRRGLEPGVFAIHIESGQSLARTTSPITTENPAHFLFHADPAAIKAQCLGTLCGKHGLAALGDSDGYLTSDSLVESPWLRSYNVLWAGHADKRQTQSAVTDLKATVTEVKTRGIKTPADKLRSQFKPAGARSLTLAAWPNGKSLRHALIEPTAP